MTIVTQEGDHYRLYASTMSSTSHVQVSRRLVVINASASSEVKLVRLSQDMLVAVGIFKSLRAGANPSALVTHVRTSSGFAEVTG